LSADRLAEQVERLAHHALQGKLWAKAVAYQRQAGAKSADRSAYREAAAHLERAVMALGHLPEDPETRGQAIDLRLELYRSLLPLAEYTRCDALHGELEGRAEVLGDPMRLARVYAVLTAHYVRSGDYGRCVESAQRALTVAAAVGDQTVQANLTLNLGIAYFWLGDYHAAVGCFRQLMGVAPVRGAFRVAPLTYSVVAGGWLAACLAELGQFAEGATLAEEALRAAEATNLPWDLAMTLHYAGGLYLQQGAFGNAVSALERCVALCESAGIVRFSRTLAATLGSAYALTEHVAEAVQLLEAVVPRTSVRAEAAGEARRVTYLGEAYLLAGRMADAVEAARRALALARQHQERGNETWALRLLGEIAAQADSPAVDQAEPYFHEALALAEELGMRPLVAHCHLGLGTLYRKIGRDEQAQSELATAAEMYRAMEMPFWLMRAEAELGQIAATG
jgi:tetratricopeptide (TPR) repeat protein